MTFSGLVLKEVPMVEKLKPDRGGNITREEGQLSKHIHPSSIFSFVIYNIVCASSMFPVAPLLLCFSVVALFWLFFYSTRYQQDKYGPGFTCSG